MSIPRQDARDAINALLRKQELDPRLPTGDPTWLADRIFDYFEQRQIGLPHDPSLLTVLAGADLILGSPAPTPMPIPAPQRALQPLEDLIVIRPGGVFAERTPGIHNGRDTKEPLRWVWRGVRYAAGYSDYQKDVQLVAPLLGWAQSLGATVLVSEPPDSPTDPAVQAFLALCRTFHLRVHWEGAKVSKSVTPQASVPDPERSILVPVPGADTEADPLDSVSTVVTDLAVPTYTPSSPDFAFWTAILAVWQTGGGTLETDGHTPHTTEAQRIAEWFFRGLGAVDPESRDWVTVMGPGPQFPVVDQAGWRDLSLAKVNGQTALVLIVNPTPARQVQGQGPWKITELSGPSHTLLRCQS